MDRPKIKGSPDMFLEGVFSSEVVDSSGEIVKIDGMDISTLEAGEGTANVEHVGVHDGLGKETVGKIVYVKKVFSKDDCEDESQKFFFDLVKGKPYLYGIVRLFDGSGHAEAQRLAAQIRDYNAHSELILVRFSIEGSTLSKRGNVVEESFAKKVALTITPANKVCNTRLMSDPNAPAGFDKMSKSVFLEDPTMMKIGSSFDLLYNPILGVGKKVPVSGALKTAIRDLILAKALSAGSMDAAPSTLTGGAALQKENISKKYAGTVLATARDYDGNWDRDKFKKKLKESFAKAELPEVSDQYLDHFAAMAEDWKVKKSTPEDSTFSRLLKSENDLVELRKATRTAVNGGEASLPDVYVVYMNSGGGQAHVGRFMVFNKQIYHLEDYHGILATLLPAGPINDLTADMIGTLTLSPYFSLQEHKIKEPEAGEANVVKLQVEKQPDPPKPSVFEYLRPGMTKPHIVEFSPSGAAIDGKALEEEDLQLLLENARKGLASIKWLSSFPGLNKAEPEPEMDIDEAMMHIRNAVRSGLLPARAERAFTKHVYTDHMIDGVGNKHASTQFLSKNKPGVYASIDANDFKHINDTYGHLTGDAAIKSFGGALKDAASKNGNIKVFRPGGDEFMAWAPTHEDMSHFLRHGRSNMEALPLINGEHKHSMSVGIGHDFGTADKALYVAKGKKLDPVTGQRLHKPGKTPNLGHSLYPGHEGEIFKPEGVTQHLPKPSSSGTNLTPRVSSVEAQV